MNANADKVPPRFPDFVASPFSEGSCGARNCLSEMAACSEPTLLHAVRARGARRHSASADYGWGEVAGASWDLGDDARTRAGNALRGAIHLTQQLSRYLPNAVGPQLACVLVV